MLIKVYRRVQELKYSLKSTTITTMEKGRKLLAGDSHFTVSSKGKNDCCLNPGELPRQHFLNKSFKNCNKEICGDHGSIQKNQNS